VVFRSIGLSFFVLRITRNCDTGIREPGGELTLRVAHASVIAAATMTLGGVLPAAADPAPLTLVLKDHRFAPATLTVPAGQRIQILVVNQDGATEEFDSHDLKVEKLVTPKSRATFSVGPLKPGSYAFMGEFHPETAQGRIIAVEARP
jgi:hypothetical protein